VSLSAFLHELAAQGVQVRAHGDELEVRVPRGVLTPAQRERLGRDKARILDLLRRHAAAPEPLPPLPPIVPRPAERFQAFPLTDIQQAYWLGRQGALELGGVGCHLYREFERSGLDLDRLERAWQLLVERHDMLRAVFSAEGEQRVLESVPACRIARLDLRGWEAGAAETALAAVREEMSHRVYAPDRWPLFDLRATLLDGGRTRIHFSLDLLLADAASILLLLREWAELYEAPVDRHNPPAVTFRDYVLAGAAWRETARFHADEAYWEERLDELPPAPRLPLARDPAGVERPQFVRRGFRLPAPAWSALRRRAERSGLTPSALLCAAYADVLAAWSGPSRFTVVLTLFQRLGDHPGVRGLVGDFTSTLLLAVDAGAGATFEERARALQARLAEDLDHSLVSGVQVARRLHRRERQPVILPVVFTSTLGHRPDGGGEAGPSLDWLGETVYGITQTPQVWLDHHAVEEGDDLVLAWDAVEALFPPGLLDDLFTAYTGFVRRLAEEELAWREPVAAHLPARQLAERAAANATGGGEPPRETLHGLAAASAARQPDSIAVIAPERALTYGELAGRAAELAARLRRQGAGPGELIAVVLEKGWEQAVAVLGILRTGAAWLPVDPSVPAERLACLLADGRVRLAVTAPGLADRLAWPGAVARLAVDASPLPNPAGGDAPAGSPDDLAYVIYTSGSTGRPKGVAIDHRGAVNTVLDINERFGLGPGDRVLALSSLSFDLSVWDLFGLLAAGGSLVVPPPETRRDPAAWLDLLERHRITVWNSVPALLEMLVEHTEGRGHGLPASLRLVLLSGDWIPPSLPGRLRALAPAARVISLGGATEASIWSIVHPIEEVDPEWASIPYGRPLRHQTFQVLNDRMEPCPVWVAGELCIGGAGLALGYWGDPVRTAERFVPDPAGHGRLYRTGDLGRYLPGGGLEILGREDRQVKIRGHRIELGEIESALTALPEVRAAVAAAVGEPRGERRLVAWVVPAREIPQAPAIPADRLAAAMSRPGWRMGNGHEGVPLTVRPALPHRRTVRHFRPEPVPFTDLAGLLSGLAAVEPEGAPLPRYHYPSAGSLYPVQTYLHVSEGRVAGLPGGTYYHHPGRHELVPLRTGARIGREAHAPNNREIFDQAAFCLFLVGRLPAIEPLYGDAARSFCLIEAGCMLQLLMTGTASGPLGLCPVGWVDFAPLEPLFELPEEHVFLHAVLGGLAAEETAAAAPPSRAGLARELREALARRLPEALIPSAFVLLDELPLTANGKVDRKALPLPEAAGGAPETAFAAPASGTERLLADLAREALGVERVGLDDNLFDLGATSLHVVRLHRRICETLRLDFPLATLFRHPTLRALSRFLAREEGSDRVDLDPSRKRAEARLAARGRRGPAAGETA
jgi:amino acid adenylation domain-containing protein